MRWESAKFKEIGNNEIHHLDVGKYLDSMHYNSRINDIIGQISTWINVRLVSDTSQRNIFCPILEKVFAIVSSRLNTSSWLRVCQYHLTQWVKVWFRRTRDRSCFTIRNKQALLWNIILCSNDYSMKICVK